MLRPWARTWLKHHQECPHNSPPYDFNRYRFLRELKRSILIAWIFGDETQFTKLTQFIGKEITLDEETNIFVENTPVVDINEIPGYFGRSSHLRYYNFRRLRRQTQTVFRNKIAWKKNIRKRSRNFAGSLRRRSNKNALAAVKARKTVMTKNAIPTSPTPTTIAYAALMAFTASSAGSILALMSKPCATP